jgi:hypothetical protein
MMRRIGSKSIWSETGTSTAAVPARHVRVVAAADEAVVALRLDVAFKEQESGYSGRPRLLRRVAVVVGGEM